MVVVAVIELVPMAVVVLEVMPMVMAVVEVVPMVAVVIEVVPPRWWWSAQEHLTRVAHTRRLPQTHARCEGGGRKRSVYATD